MVIYKITFPNGKVYIGKCKDLRSRKSSHRYSMNNNSNKTRLKRAFLKYGFDSVSWEVVFETNDSNLLNEKEIYFIEKYNSVKTGYNITIGGDGGNTISHNDRKLEIIKQQLKTKGISPDKYIVIDEELSNKIINDYVNNKNSIKGIGRKYAISHQRIRRFLLSKNIELDKDRGALVNSIKLTEEQINIVIEKYKNGSLINDISKQESLTIQTVSRILHDSGVRKSKRFKDGKRYDGRPPKKGWKHNDTVG
jgi:group I intron endonuclease